MKLRGISLLVAGSVAVGTMIGITLAGASAAGGAVEHTKVIQRTFVVRQGHVRVFDITCPSGYVPVGGGGHEGAGVWLGSNPAYTGISESDVDLTHTGWAVTAFVTNAQSRTSFTADAVCATWSS
jgi:hypothetical protein